MNSDRRDIPDDVQSIGVADGPFEGRWDELIAQKEYDRLSALEARGAGETPDYWSAEDAVDEKRNQAKAALDDYLAYTKQRPDTRTEAVSEGMRAMAAIASAPPDAGERPSFWTDDYQCEYRSDVWLIDKADDISYACYVAPMEMADSVLSAARAAAGPQADRVEGMLRSLTYQVKSPVIPEKDTPDAQTLIAAAVARTAGLDPREYDCDPRLVDAPAPDANDETSKAIRDIARNNDLPLGGEMLGR